MAIQRYVAFLRGVSPMNAKMADVRRCFETAGFGDVKTLLSSGNVIFSAPEGEEDAIARKAEQAMSMGLGRTFATIVRSTDALRDMLNADPFAAFRLPKGAKKVVTFLRDDPKSLSLPIKLDGATILARRGHEVFTAYVRSPRGPVFMKLLEKTFGSAITTRTWETVKKAAADCVAPGSTASPKVVPRSGATWKPARSRHPKTRKKLAAKAQKKSRARRKAG